MSDENRPFNLPAHGTRKRYRVHGCKCVACTRGPLGIDLPEKLTWPYRFIARKADEEYIKAWCTEEEIENWKINGLGDYEADNVCVRLGFLPQEVFPGYLEAGLDCEVYP